MMGALHNDSIRASRRRRFPLRGGLVLTTIAVGLLVTSGATAADPAPSQAPRPETTAPEPERAVSTSPASRGPSSRDGAAANAGSQNGFGRPLTRAAAQLRVESISPTDWLSRFGSVSIGQLE